MKKIEVKNYETKDAETCIECMNEIYAEAKYLRDNYLMPFSLILT